MRQVTLKTNRLEVFNHVTRIARKLDFRILHRSRKNWKMELKYDGDLISFGNKIYIQFHLERQGCTVDVTSKSAVFLQLVDWGKNEELEDTLIKEIKAIDRR